MSNDLTSETLEDLLVEARMSVIKGDPVMVIPVRQPMETAPRDRLILLHERGFAGERNWTIGRWVVSRGFGAWYSVEKDAFIERGELDSEEIRVGPDGWAELPGE